MEGVLVKRVPARQGVMLAECALRHVSRQGECCPPRACIPGGGRRGGVAYAGVGVDEARTALAARRVRRGIILGLLLVYYAGIYNRTSVTRCRIYLIAFLYHDLDIAVLPICTYAECYY